MSHEENNALSPDMMILDLISDYPQTEPVLRSYDEQAGECICCQMLFESIRAVAQKYNLDLTELMQRIERSIVG